MCGSDGGGAMIQTPLPRARVRGRARVSVDFCRILSNLPTVGLGSSLGARCDWEWNDGRRLGALSDAVGSSDVSHLGLSPLGMVRRSRHNPSVVREFCFVKCESVSSMRLCRCRHGRAADAAKWNPLLHSRFHGWRESYATPGAPQLCRVESVLADTVRGIRTRAAGARAPGPFMRPGISCRAPGRSRAALDRRARLHSRSAAERRLAAPLHRAPPGCCSILRMNPESEY